VNASKARRRWIAWCRYAAKTGTLGNAAHRGHAKAHENVMTAGRAYPRGLRPVYYPGWFRESRG